MLTKVCALMNFCLILTKLLLHGIVGEQSKILPEDKVVVRENILNFIAQVPPILRYHHTFTLYLGL